MKFDDIKVGKYYVISVLGIILYKVISKNKKEKTLRVEIIKDTCPKESLRFSKETNFSYYNNFVKFSKMVSEDDIVLYML